MSGKRRQRLLLNRSLKSPAPPLIVARKMIATSDIKFDLDERGWRRASAPEGFTALEEFFVADLQSNESWIRDFIQKACEIISGDREWFERDGNTCMIDVKPDLTLIAHQYFDTFCTIPTKVLIEINRHWQTFVSEAEAPKKVMATSRDMTTPTSRSVKMLSTNYNHYPVVDVRSRW